MTTTPERSPDETPEHMPQRAADLIAAGYCPTDCGARIGVGMLMCRPCWRDVPAHLQREVTVAWRGRQAALAAVGGEVYVKAADRHERAKAAAIAAVA